MHYTWEEITKMNYELAKHIMNYDPTVCRYVENIQYIRFSEIVPDKFEFQENMMSYNLFIDDLREVSYISNIVSPFVESDWKVCRTSSDAISCVIEHGIPEFISFDHDLGEEDTVMVFLKKWTVLFPLNKFPDYYIHSSNPVGKENIESFVRSFNNSF